MPFNFFIRIILKQAQPARITLTVYNTVGQEVIRPVDRAMMSAGIHKIAFNAADQPSGVYFYVFATSETQMARKLILLK